MGLHNRNGERKFDNVNVTYLSARRQENYGQKRKSREENSVIARETVLRL
jgi:hypothetical protein